MNRLQHASSPYLLQHAHNPVDWYEWGEEALTKAIREDKPIILSIGYAACHWCHVMERETFENEEMAKIMNQYFVCIKVDREERPDIDAIYMDAVQAMGQQGGWPLNAFLTPTAKPFYAGTYFPPKYWENLLLRIANLFQTNRKDIEKSAEQFKDTLNRSEIQKYGLQAQEATFTPADLERTVAQLILEFDTTFGGMQKAPKFPMPCLYEFLLHYSTITKNEGHKKALATHLETTLLAMAQGGLYDHIGGGFARYSVDAEWFAPHFEKMLYDNGQLLSLYAHAYAHTPNPRYKEVIYDTARFVQRELTDEFGGFYSSLDADSEGVEGKFYCWTEAQLEEILPEKAEKELFMAYYQCKKEGNWEHDFNILYARRDVNEFLKKYNFTQAQFSAKIQDWQARGLAHRENRVRPSLDDKVLTSWNALMLKGLIDAYNVFDEDEFLDMALENAYFIKNRLIKYPKKLQSKVDNNRPPSGTEGLLAWNEATIPTQIRGLYHNYKNKKASIDAYLEDYALVIQAYIALYQVRCDMQWLMLAKLLADYAIDNFYDEKEGLFFFTDQKSETLIARKKEIFDNVIPASNSIMAKNLHFLGLYFYQERYANLAQKMTSQMRRIILQNIEYLAHWGEVYLCLAYPTAEVAIVGEDFAYTAHKLGRYFLPNKVIAGAPEQMDMLAMLQDRPATEGKTFLYVCKNKTCNLPTESLEQAKKEIL
jgi:hypothetical protein